MVYVFFVPGMFGSTIEYVLRNYTKELDPVYGKILDDGSLHSFKKQAHVAHISDLNSLSEHILDLDNNISVITQTYPFQQTRLPEILSMAKSVITENDQCILLYADSVAGAELNMLFQYHKICVGLNKTLDIFCLGNSHNIVNWNKNYQHWKDMQPWELREWFSMFYIDWIQEWIDSQAQVPANWLKISNVDFLNNPDEAIDQIIQFCGLTEKPEIEQFFQEWKQKQQYVIDEMSLINHISKSTVKQVWFAWEPLNIIAESMIQQKLQSQGYKIRCDGLNTFPTDTETLYNLLEKC
jgi:hypothetical protein